MMSWCSFDQAPLAVVIAATQALNQRPANASAAAAPVRAMPQYKYAAGVRNPQQHMASQPQVTMQQVRMPLTLISVDVIHKYNCCKFSKCTPSGYSTLNAVVLINFFIIINFISPLPKWGSDFRTWHSYVLLNKQKVIQVFMTIWVIVIHGLLQVVKVWLCSH